MGGGPGRPVGGPFPGRARADEFAGSFDLDDIPDLVPIAKWVIAGVAVVLAIGIAGAVSGTWTTVLLWINRVPFSPDSTVVDPVFGRDISFFLFDLPFLRFVQSLLNGLLLASLLVAGARYLAQATAGRRGLHHPGPRPPRGARRPATSCRWRSATSSTSSSSCTAPAGIATGVSYTDANARFMAYDVLTILSGIAAALLVAGAFTRWLWPLGLVVIVWFSASLVLGRLYPEVVQRFTVDPNQFAQEEPYIANNIAMTRTAFELDQWTNRDYSGTAPLTEAALRLEVDTFDQRAPVGLPPPRRDAGPAPDRSPVLRLRGRRHGSLHGRRRAAPGHALGPRAGDRAEPPGDRLGATSGSSTPTASGWPWSR